MLNLSFCRSTIRDKIIPHAVSWFTGEAIQGDELEIEDDDEEDEDIDGDEDDEEEDDDEEEEDDDDEDDEDEVKTKKKVWYCCIIFCQLYHIPFLCLNFEFYNETNC